MATLAPSQINASVCYLETIGRVSGRPHEIEIWFAADGDTIWMLSGGMDRSDWVRNLQHNPAVRVRIAGEWLTGRAAIVTDPARGATRPRASRRQVLPLDQRPAPQRMEPHRPADRD